MHRRLSLRTPRIFLLFVLGVVLAAGMLATGTISFAQDSLSADEALAQFRATAGGELTTSTERATGNLNFLNAPAGAVLAADDASARPEARATAFLQRYGSVMGIRDAATELQPAQVVPDEFGMTHVRMNQLYNGLPVFGAQIVVHLNDEGVTGVNGTFVRDINVGTTAEVSRATAAMDAIKAVGEANPDVALSSADAGLAVYHTGLLQGVAGESLLAYDVVVEGEGVKEQVWIDAVTGKVLNRISLIHTDLDRRVYTPTYDPNNPDANVVRTEGGPQVNPLHPTVDSPPDDLYDFSGQTYFFFFNGFNRDSYDGAGATMRTVYLINDQCPNAYWNGESTNYCPGFDVDDVVAHEWGHAYTQFTHGLIYQYQSGALNESYSDIWGETVDLFNNVDDLPNDNSPRTDTDPGDLPSSQRWLVGEDLSEAARLLLLRDMWNPEGSPVTDPDPAKVSSEFYYCDSGDNGGVHSNSGVPNHAFAMLTDGKSYNGQDIAALGFIKTTHIYYRAMTAYQTPTSNFTDHANALEQSCQDLIGDPLTDFETGAVSGETISAADCAEVAQAMEAVEMRVDPAPLCNYQPLLKKEAPLTCDSASYLLDEDWESGGTLEQLGWSLGRERAADPAGDSFEEQNYNWVIAGDLPPNPDNSPREGSALFAIDEREAGTCQAGAGDISGHYWVDSPELTIEDDQTTVRFEHWVSTELSYDGGNLKISINGGEFQVIPGEQSENSSAGGAYTYNAPNQELDPGASDLGTNTNPLAGQTAWTGSDEGGTSGSWGTSIVDLSAIVDEDGNPLVGAGDRIVLRYDFGIDGCNGVTGWYVDRVEVFACQAPTAITVDSVGGAPTVQLWPLALGGIALASAGMLVLRRRRAVKP